MKLSISNIAWPHANEFEILEYLTSTHVSGIEIAPSRIWPDFRLIDTRSRTEYTRKIHDYGLTICSMHSLYYGQNDMSIFGSPSQQERFSDFTMRLIELASDMEIPRMVMGSPTIRDQGELGYQDALEQAAEILRPLADYAESCGTRILIEALSLDETRFINSHKESLILIKYVNSRGFGLHLDAKAISSEEEELEDIFAECAGQIEHFHVNEKGLGGFEQPMLAHDRMAACLKNINYNEYVSIEMRQLPSYMDSIKNAVNFVSSVYEG